METAITIYGIIGAFAILTAFVGGGTAVKKVIDAINGEHDKMQKYDGYEERINELDKRIEKAHVYATDKLAELSLDTDAKLQDIKSEQCLLTYCMMATLDGLHQLGANGQVTEARKMLDKHLNKQAHGVD